MQYEWDEAKRATNLEKHGVDFEVIDAFDWETAISKPSPRGGELRHVATGYITDDLYRVIFTWRAERVRVISLRRANGRERRDYEQIR